MNRNVPLAVVAALIAAAVVLVACGGDGDEQLDATSTRPSPTGPPPRVVVTPDATAAASVDVLPWTAVFAEYAAVVADYLSEGGSADLGTPCLTDLISEMEMADLNVRLTPQERCLTGNTDADADEEIVVLFSTEVENPFRGLVSNLVVFDKTAEGYEAVYQSWAMESYPAVFPQRIVAAEDITRDGKGDLVYTDTACGAHTCTLYVHVLTGTGDTEYIPLTPEGGGFPDERISMTTADVLLEDRDGDGVPEIVLHGGFIDSAGAGPQRTRTEVYGWDGDAFTLLETTFDPSDLRYFSVTDANDAFSDGDYGEAVRRYEQAINDPDLREVRNFGSREELIAYATFRLGLSRLMLDDLVGASEAFWEAIESFPVSLMGQAAGAFRSTVDLTRVAFSGDVAAGCEAVGAFLRQNLDRFDEVWYYGYANPEPEPEDVCPF